VFIIYVLFKIKLYKNYIHCLFERYVNIYLFSMFVNNHICALVLLFGTNCPYECRNNCQKFAIRHVIFYLFAISFFLGWNYLCLGIEPLFDLLIFTAVDKVKDLYCITRCEKIIKHTGTSVNIIYYIVALLQYEYTSKEIIISLIRS
jgi:hypothetical protein